MSEINLMRCSGCGRIWDQEETTMVATRRGCPGCGTPCVAYPDGEFASYADVCPLCDQGLRLVAFTASCNIPVQSDGWAYSDGPCDSTDEKFECPEHRDVPSAWVSLHMGRREAAEKMEHAAKQRAKARAVEGS